MSQKNFSGSYSSEDVIFLLKPVDIPLTSLEEKEKNIQHGKKHYSEMLSPEKLPSAQYIELFEHAMQRHAQRFAQDILQLARFIKEKNTNNEITLLSLARAGTPVGVLLKRTLNLLQENNVEHYSVSIIRDRGLDENALKYILKERKRTAKFCIFIDGWTGKGVISRELKKTVKDFNEKYSKEFGELPDSLYVLADLCGYADIAASYEDYIIPSSLLNAIISGLISRSVLNNELVKENDFHACAYYEEWKEQDISRSFVDTIFEKIQQLHKENFSAPIPNLEKHKEICPQLQENSKNFLLYCQENYNITDQNLIKPGIGEATRVLLRRVPHIMLLKDENNPDTQHIIRLAQEKNVPIVIKKDLPYSVVGLIKNV